MAIMVICLAIVLIALVIGAIMGNQARKGIQSELNKMSQTMAPLQQEVNEMQRQTSLLSEKQSFIQHSIEKSKSDVQETIQTVKEIPGMYKELFAANSDRKQTAAH